MSKLVKKCFVALLGVVCSLIVNFHTVYAAEGSSIMQTEFYQFAVNQTKVPMPNCYTYAIARESQIIGVNTILEDCSKPKIRGAGDLWGSHSKEFEESQIPQVGSVAVWQGGLNSFGHVAIVEEVYNNGEFKISQSNYEGNCYEELVISQDSFSSLGLKFAGFLNKREPETKKEKEEIKKEKREIKNPFSFQSKTNLLDGYK